MRSISAMPVAVLRVVPAAEALRDLESAALLAGVVLPAVVVPQVVVLLAVDLAAVPTLRQN